MWRIPSHRLGHLSFSSVSDIICESISSRTPRTRRAEFKHDIKHTHDAFAYAHMRISGWQNTYAVISSNYIVQKLSADLIYKLLNVNNIAVLIVASAFVNRDLMREVAEWKLYYYIILRLGYYLCCVAKLF